MTVANLGLAVDSSTVASATPALDRMTAASQRAEAAAGQLGRASSSTSGTMKQLMSVVQSIERDLTVLVNRSLEAGRSLERVGNSLPRIGAGMNSATMNTANIAAQFQDIAVSAQMGMGALQIGLQQGTQLAAVIAAMENPLKGIGAAFLSVLSPVSLLVIGLTSLLAVGLQMVNWTAVAKGALNAVADSLEVIAPYAVAAAAGLALLYAPALIAGAANLVLSLGSVAKGIWGVAAAIYATVGLPVLLIAGLTAMAAAAVIWRDDLAKMLGFDIVQVAQDGINAVVGFFVGAFNAVTGVWNNLPAIFSDIFTMAMNGAIDIVQNGINGIIGPIRDLMSSVGLEGPALADLQGFKGKPTGAAADAGKVIAGAFADAQGTDYVGIAIKGVQTAASGAADALHGLADGLKLTTEEDKKAAKEAKRLAEAYADITRGARQRIEASQLEMQTLGMTTEQINAQRYAQELMNKAANDNIKLTPKQTEELTALGAAMAAAEAATKALKDAYDFGKETFRGFFADLKTGIEDGKGLWGSLADAGVNALQRIADKALSMAADGIWDMIFGAITSGLTGGLTGGAKTGVGFIPGLGSIGRNANGTDNWRGGLSWVGEEGPELVNLPLGAQVIPHGPSMAMAANQNSGGINIGSITIQAASEKEGAAAARGFVAELNRHFPAAMERYQRNPLRRAG